MVLLGDCRPEDRRILSRYNNYGLGGLVVVGLQLLLLVQELARLEIQQVLLAGLEGAH